MIHPLYMFCPRHTMMHLFLQSAADNKPEALGNSLSRDKEGPDADDKTVFPCVNMIKGELVGGQLVALNISLDYRAHSLARLFRATTLWIETQFWKQLPCLVDLQDKATAPISSLLRHLCFLLFPQHRGRLHGVGSCR